MGRYLVCDTVLKIARLGNENERNFHGFQWSPETMVSKVDRQILNWCNRQILNFKNCKINISTMKYSSIHWSQFPLKGKVTFLWCWGLSSQRQRVTLGKTVQVWEGFFQSPRMTSLDNPFYSESARINMPKLDSGVCFKQCSFRNPAWFVRCAICYSKYTEWQETACCAFLPCLNGLLRW